MTITLEMKRPAHLVPSYSLTGDLLSFERCNLQYRYYNGSSLPPSRPVQLWYGEFVHGVLEAAFRAWSEMAPRAKFPWPCNPTEWRQEPPSRLTYDIGELGERIEAVLRAQGKEARSRKAREAAYRRATAAVNELGPILFPLISDAETKVIGTRALPKIPNQPEIRADRYEVHGVIDVVTEVSLGSVPKSNPLRAEVERVCGTLPDHFEIIADYKGATRPRTDNPYWTQGEWQVQTYAWLRKHQTLDTPIVAGVLLYIDELSPGSSTMSEIAFQVRKGLTDVPPTAGSQDEIILRNWHQGQRTDQLSLEYRLRRAIRVIPVTDASLINATAAFDGVVRRIEENIEDEARRGTIASVWEANCVDERTCVACDFRHFCPRMSAGPARAPSAP